KEDALFEWINGKDVLYTNWAPREPNLTQIEEHCVMAYYSEYPELNGKWGLDPCGDEEDHAYMCQMPLQPMTDPPEIEPEEGCPSVWVAYRWKC
ncbi:hypothetical protein P5F03_15275, partial [Clostridium perfringens]|nr:hypothetical protein [Clostridium perfringens]